MPRIGCGLAGGKWEQMEPIITRSLVDCGIEVTAGTALSALWYLGRRQVTPDVVASVRTRLGPEEFAALEAASGEMPGWLAAVLQQQHKEARNG
jgi:hypothetical protein